MASIEITRDELIVHIHGWSRVLALRGSLRIPMSHVRGARVRPEEANFDEVIIESWRGIGTYMPRKLAAGYVYTRAGASFYDVRDPERAIAVDVVHENVQHIVVQVDGEEPEEAVHRIRQMLMRRSSWPPAALGAAE